MDLLGLPALIGVITLAVLVTVVSLVVWKRLRGPAVVQVLQRLLLILLCQVTALAVVGVSVNRQYEFYATFGEFLNENSAQAAPPPQQQHVIDPPSAASTVKFVPYGNDGVRVATVSGPVSGIRAQVYVWVPPQYKADRTKRFPVVELLPGFPGPAHNWFTMMNVTKLMAQEANPAILVSVTTQVRSGQDADCTDLPGGPQVQTWVATDVRRMVESAFRTTRDRRGWATMGYSEGGYCAVKVAVQHPRDFSAAVSLSGYLTPTAPAVTRSPRLLAANDMLKVLGRRHPRVSLLAMATRQDAATAMDVSRLRSVAKSPTQVFSSILAAGGHNYGVWNAMLPQAVSWLTAHLSAA
ncbi:alpha/beta hydrolase [Nonomuraea sp. NPDC050536]|uniref:alpha/beta hydrolase n=1 Tax=Nonomuraea sp. NPDC050536 TaxID=3364366 RepID=UPI0037C78041